MHCAFAKAFCGHTAQKPHATCASRFVQHTRVKHHTFEIHFERAAVVTLNKLSACSKQSALERKQNRQTGSNSVKHNAEPHHQTDVSSHSTLSPRDGSLEIQN